MLCEKGTRYIYGLSGFYFFAGVAIDLNVLELYSDLIGFLSDLCVAEKYEKCFLISLLTTHSQK